MKPGAPKKPDDELKKTVTVRLHPRIIAALEAAKKSGKIKYVSAFIESLVAKKLKVKK